MNTDVIEQDTLLQIAHEKKTATKILVIGRDSLSSGILANALMHHITCDAAAVQSAELLRALEMSRSALVIISAGFTSGIGDGFDLATRVSKAHPRAHIVILLDRLTREAVIRAFHTGARGVFYAQQSIDELIDCVEHVRKGFMWAGREISDVFLETFRSLPAPSSLTGDESNTLTKRELQVVQCAARGKSNKMIASELCLSEHTVKNYLFRAFEKLGVTNRMELLFHLTVRGQSLAEQEPLAEAEPVQLAR